MKFHFIIKLFFELVHFSFIIESTAPLIREKLMSGKLLIEWRHDFCAEIAKKRYLSDQDVVMIAHAEIVNLFFPHETSDDSEEIHSETSEKSGKSFSLIEIYHRYIISK